MMNKLYVYWWVLNRKDGKDNYGDILTPYLIEKISGKTIVRVKYPSMRRYKWLIKHYLTVGSIISAASRNSVVWGSGIIRKNEIVRKAKFVAVRGPKTRERLLQLGYKVPEVYGDPAILLPNYLPNIFEKKYELGIIPHYVDYDEINELVGKADNVKVINLMTDDVKKTTSEILECKKIISSSLHGVIVSHAYHIPALWVRFSEKLSGDNIKFHDYFESVGIEYEKDFFIDGSNFSLNLLEELLSQNSKIAEPDYNLLEYRKEELIRACPFKVKKCV